jgi:hypothetical protein
VWFWAHITSLTPSLFIEMTLPRQESKPSCICVLWLSNMLLSIIFRFNDKHNITDTCFGWKAIFHFISHIGSLSRSCCKCLLLCFVLALGFYAMHTCHYGQYILKLVVNLLLSTIFLLDFGTVQRVWSFFFFLF